MTKKNQTHQENPYERDMKKFADKAALSDLMRVLDGLSDMPEDHIEIPFPYGRTGPRPGSWGDKKKASGE